MPPGGDGEKGRGTGAAFSPSYVGAGGAAPLGKITGLCTPGESSEKSRAVSRAERWAMLAAVRELLPGERVAVCKKILVEGRVTVDIWYSPERRRAYLKNLVSCSNAWACPVCSQKIAEGRRVELKRALSNADYHPVLVTVTIAHKQGDTLKAVLNVLRRAWSRTKQGKGWGLIESRFDMLHGAVTSLETTYGAAGWHPHMHIVFWSRHLLSSVEREALQAALAARFSGYVAGLGGYASVYHSIEVSESSVACEYAAKWGLDSELTRGASKTGGVNPFGLLWAYMAGDEQAGRLFVEYAEAFKGRKQLQWSKGLKRLFGVTEKSDEEAAEEEQSEVDYILGRIPLAGWRVILSNHIEADFFRVADRGDAGALAAWLLEYGIEV